jgi:hypothetical protein
LAVACILVQVSTSTKATFFLNNPFGAVHETPLEELPVFVSSAVSGGFEAIIVARLDCRMNFSCGARGEQGSVFFFVGRDFQEREISLTGVVMKSLLEEMASFLAAFNVFTCARSGLLVSYAVNQSLHRG